MNSLLLSLVLVVGIYLGVKMERRRYERERERRIACIGRGTEKFLNKE